jgi:hypothetical protein
MSELYFGIVGGSRDDLEDLIDLIEGGTEDAEIVYKLPSEDRPSGQKDIINVQMDKTGGQSDTTNEQEDIAYEQEDKKDTTNEWEDEKAIDVIDGQKDEKEIEIAGGQEDEQDEEIVVLVGGSKLQNTTKVDKSVKHSSIVARIGDIEDRDSESDSESGSDNDNDHNDHNDDQRSKIVTGSKETHKIRFKQNEKIICDDYITALREELSNLGIET